MMPDLHDIITDKVQRQMASKLYRAARIDVKHIDIRNRTHWAVWNVIRRRVSGLIQQSLYDRQKI